MEQPVIHALDFDGVICDSALETGIAGWKAATRIWDDMRTPLPAPELVEQFRLARPVIEIGYESIVAMRLLFNGIGVDSIVENFQNQKQEILAQKKLDVAELKRLFGEVRDRWIDAAPEEWRRMNPLFPGVADKLAHLSERGVVWYIVTTKQERFVREILAANRIGLTEDRIFGMDRNMNKEQVLAGLLAHHPQQAVHFVEDRLPTLLKMLENEALRSVKLFLADWGYNTREDKREAERQASISMISLENFLN